MAAVGELNGLAEIAGEEGPGARRGMREEGGEGVHFLIRAGTIGNILGTNDHG
jgi:hypothetical protein